MIARLQSGRSINQAGAEFDAAYQAREATDKNPNPGLAILEPITQGSFALHDSFQSALSLLSWGLAAFLAMICANVAGLLLALAMRHERDTALRVALGASRIHLAGRAMTESLSLGLAGGAAGILLSYAFAPLTAKAIACRPRARVAHTGLLDPVALRLRWPWPSALSSARFPRGSVHALHRSRLFAAVLPPGGAGLLSKSLLVLQISLTFILLVGGGLLIRTYYALRNTSPGFDVDHLVEFTLNSQVAGTT